MLLQYFQVKNIYMQLATFFFKSANYVNIEIAP